MGVLNANHIAASYGHHIVLLILGAFFVAKAIKTNNLHKRIALFTILLIGTSMKEIFPGLEIILRLLLSCGLYRQ